MKRLSPGKPYNLTSSFTVGAGRVIKGKYALFVLNRGMHNCPLLLFRRDS